MDAPTLVELLDFEANNPGRGWRKGEAIQTEFGIKQPRYYQLLRNILETPQHLTQALRHNPTVTNRLLRGREEATAARKARQ